MRILYVAIHEALEFDDLKIFTSLGHRVFSVNAFGTDDVRGTLRQPLPEFFSPEDHNAFIGEGSTRGPLIISKKFVDRFDLIIVNHDPHFVKRNEASLEGAVVIFRTIGQSLPITERLIGPYLPGLTLVRYSPLENELPRFHKSGKVIRFGKYIGELSAVRRDDRVLTFINHLNRVDACPARSAYDEIVNDLPVDLYGPQNEGIEQWRGVATDQLGLFRSCGAYLYVHSGFAQYTLGLIEAMATGCAIVAPSVKYIDKQFHGSANWHSHRYEVESILNGCGLLFDTNEQARSMLLQLLDGRIDRQTLGQKAQEKAAKMFNAELIGQQWNALFASVVNGTRRFRKPSAWQRFKSTFKNRQIKF